MTTTTETQQAGYRIRFFHDVYGSRAFLRESSVILDYEDSVQKPGSSALWLGAHSGNGHIHLNREMVQGLINEMECWLETGRLRAEG